MCPLAKIIEFDTQLTTTEKDLILRFKDIVDSKCKEPDGYLNIHLDKTLELVGIDNTKLVKDGAFIYALYSIFLLVLKKFFKCHELKYPAYTDFIGMYPAFESNHTMAIIHLWETANWMNVLFRFIPARKNKGLVLAVIPRVVEGWDVKYITGSGQKKATSDRVTLFEKEGGAETHTRNKPRKKDSAQSTNPVPISAPSQETMETTLTAEEMARVKMFQEVAEDQCNCEDGNVKVQFSEILALIGLGKTALVKDGQLMYALWITLLTVIKTRHKQLALKYPLYEDFCREYPTEFSNESEGEKMLLWEIANWMNVLFQLIAARKNKGLVMNVVPRVVEGWGVKYITGSGQKRATTNRVLLFERESGIGVFHRKAKRSVECKLEGTHEEKTARKTCKQGDGDGDDRGSGSVSVPVNAKRPCVEGVQREKVLVDLRCPLLEAQQVLVNQSVKVPTKTEDLVVFLNFIERVHVPIDAAV